jgi:uncharacterized protein (TIGR02611 family)
MLRRLRKSWHDFKKLEPGKRFQQRYRQGPKAGKLRKLLFLGGGTLIMIAGLFSLPAPGPGFLILFVGAGLVAQQSLIAARALDWTELRVRRLLAWARRVWRKASVPVRIALIFAAVLVALAVGYGAYQLVFAQ